MEIAKKWLGLVEAERFMLDDPVSSDVDSTLGLGVY